MSQLEVGLVAQSSFVTVAPVLISASAFVVSVVSLLFVVSARPRIRMRVSRTLMSGEFDGDLLDIFNIGRRSVVIAEVGIRGDDGSLFFPHGRVGGTLVPEAARAPMVLEAGGAATFHFALGDSELEAARAKNGYVLTTVGKKRPWRPDGLKRTFLRHAVNRGENWN